MKWVFSFNDWAFPHYADLIRVAVTTAQANTSLEPHCFYQGKQSPLTDWIQAQGIPIHLVRSRLYDDLEQLGRDVGNEELVSATGAFLRLEIPSVTRQLGWTDEYVFYTDGDVAFLRDPMPLIENLRPRLFAVAPEKWIGNYLHMNTGVMLVNLAAVRAVDEEFQKFAQRHLKLARKNAWDQGCYRAFFDPFHRWLWKMKVPDRISYKFLLKLPLSKPQWEPLPPELNWKPYWPFRDDVTIFHFHGPKATERQAMENGIFEPVHRTLYNENFAHWCDWWEAQRDQLVPLAP